MVQGHIADMALDVDAAALLVYRAAWTKDMGAARVTREAAMAKLFATDKAQEVIDKAVQLHGGDGVRKGHIVESLYREIRALRIYEGASDVQKVVIARQVMGGTMAFSTSRAAGNLAHAYGGVLYHDARTIRAHRHFHARQPAAARPVAGPPARRLRLSRAPQCRRRADRPAGREGFRRPHRADRQWPPPHLQGTVRLDEPARACAGRELRRQAGQPGADPLGQQSGHGRLLAGRDQGRRRGGQHHADAARRRTRARSSTRPRSRSRSATRG